MSTITPSTVVPNVASLATPFVPPPLCRTVQDLTITTTTTYFSNRTKAIISVPFLFSDPANSDYGACLPTPLQRTWSGAVCPLSWTAYYMSTRKFASSTLSTARCCSSGFNLALKSDYRSYPVEIMCIASYASDYGPAHEPTSILVTMSSGGAPTATTVFSTGVRAHPPWIIAWQEKDLLTLSPRPPDLTSDMLIQTWTAGQYIRPGEYDNNGSGRTQSSSRELGKYAAFLVIGLPIIIATLVISCCCYCFWSKRPMARNRARERAEAEAVAVEDGDQPGIDGDSILPRYSVNGGRQPPPDYELATMTPAITVLPTTTIVTPTTPAK